MKFFNTIHEMRETNNMKSFFYAQTFVAAYVSVVLSACSGTVSSPSKNAGDSNLGNSNETARNAASAISKSPSGYSLATVCRVSEVDGKLGMISTCNEIYIDSTLSEREISRLKTLEDANCLRQNASARTSDTVCEAKPSHSCLVKGKRSQKTKNPADASIYEAKTSYFPDATKSQVTALKARMSTFSGDVTCTPDVE